MGVGWVEVLGVRKRFIAFNNIVLAIKSQLYIQIKSLLVRHRSVGLKRSGAINFGALKRDLSLLPFPLCAPIGTQPPVVKVPQRESQYQNLLKARKI